MTFKRTLFLLLLLSFLFRLYRIQTPVADWHSFRQADTASVTREYVKHGIDLLRPRYHDLSNIQSGVNTGGIDNLDGWRMVEFPIVNGVIAAVLRIFAWDLVITSRLFSIVASLGSLLFLALWTRRIFGTTVALVSAALFGLMPYSIYYSRVILPEPFLVFFLMLSTWGLTEYYAKATQRKVSSFYYVITFALSFALALLIKPMAIFYLPLFGGIVLYRRGIRGLFDPRVIVLGVLSLLPIYLWREWIQQFPTGIPWSDWLYNQDGIRLRPAWFRWLFYERLTKLMLGYTGVLFFTLGSLVAIRGLFLLSILKNRFPKESIPALWGVGLLSYLIIFATGNVRHDYYQILLVPFVCLVSAMGVSWVWQQAQSLKTTANRVVLLAILSTVVVSWYFAWDRVKDYYNINFWEIVEAGHAVDQLVPADAKVIAPYNGDTAFLFQTNRTGWPIGFDIEKKIAGGASYYVSVNYDDEARKLEEQYQVVEKTNRYIIINLTKKKENTKPNLEG